MSKAVQQTKQFTFPSTALELDCRQNTARTTAPAPEGPFSPKVGIRKRKKDAEEKRLRSFLLLLLLFSSLSSGLVLVFPFLIFFFSKKEKGRRVCTFLVGYVLLMLVCVQACIHGSTSWNRLQSNKNTGRRKNR